MPTCSSNIRMTNKSSSRGVRGKKSSKEKKNRSERRLEEQQDQAPPEDDALVPTRVTEPQCAPLATVINTSDLHVRRMGLDREGYEVVQTSTGRLVGFAYGVEVGVMLVVLFFGYIVLKMQRVHHTHEASNNEKASVGEAKEKEAQRTYGAKEKEAQRTYEAKEKEAAGVREAKEKEAQRTYEAKEKEAAAVREENAKEAAAVREENAKAAAGAREERQLAAKHAETAAARKHSGDQAKAKHQQDETMARVHETAVELCNASASHNVGWAHESDAELRGLIDTYCATLDEKDVKGRNAVKYAVELFGAAGYGVLVAKAKKQKTTVAGLLADVVKRISGGSGDQTKK